MSTPGGSRFTRAQWLHRATYQFNEMSAKDLQAEALLSLIVVVRVLIEAAGECREGTYFALLTDAYERRVNAGAYQE